MTHRADYILSHITPYLGLRLSYHIEGPRGLPIDGARERCASRLIHIGAPPLCHLIHGVLTMSQRYARHGGGELHSMPSHLIPLSRNRHPRAAHYVQLNERVVEALLWWVHSFLHSLLDNCLTIRPVFVHGYRRDADSAIHVTWAAYGTVVIDPDVESLIVAGKRKCFTAQNQVLS